MPTTPPNVYEAPGSISSQSNAFTNYDLLCFSHLRWNFVTQRPQHLMSRSAEERRTFFWEEPLFDSRDGSWLESVQQDEQLWVLRPHLPPSGDRFALERGLLNKFVQDRGLSRYVSWYYTPMALAFSGHLRAAATVYDCMDELSGFLGAPTDLQAWEAELFRTADVVFTGGISLYRAKKEQHSNVHSFPSSVDVAHFASAKHELSKPPDQAAIASPRVGFFGVLDERFDAELMKQVIALRPDMQFVFIGPVVKIDPVSLPQGPNVHYLGVKSYQDLPGYLSGWDVATLPFALNDSTRFISPTKTPEYLAAGKRVVSTPIRDVVEGYGSAGLVEIAATPDEFASALDRAMRPAAEGWEQSIQAKLAESSWDTTWTAMRVQMDKAVASKYVAPLPVRKADAGSPARKLERVDYLVVGAGFAGAVLAERLAAGMGKRVLIIDKRDHIGGNAYDHHDCAGILVHKYGPHIFHTNSDQVVQYLSKFTSWRPYEHKVLASVDGKLLPIPINLDTINRLYGLSFDASGMQRFLAERTITPAAIRTSEDICLSRVGRELYEKFFRNYTRKQWGLDPSQLDSSVAGRIPVRFDQDDRYFTDTFQAMPLHGYTRMFERMLDHPRIQIRTGVEYAEVASAYPSAKVIFTGPVDEYFGYRFGPLPYRSLQFRHETHDVETYQQAAVVNYPNDHDYTRITEFKYLTGQVSRKTSIVFEHPQSEGDPYYPIPRPENLATYQKYKELADSTDRVEFVGRLACYRYYNMDQVVAQALGLFKRISGVELPAMVTGGAVADVMAEAR